MASSPADTGERTATTSSTAASAPAVISKPPSSIARQPSSFSRQASIYSLTLDEFQNALGEPGKHFGSMNMDEFLKNIWTAEESQAMAVAMGTDLDDPPHSQGWQPNVPRQGSISLPRTLSRKTVEDVWKDIANAGIDMGLGVDPPSGSGKERQVTFAEMTLEDFLMRAGVVTKDNVSGSQSLAPFGISFNDAFNSAVTGNDDIAERIGHGSAFFSYKALEDDKPNVKGFPSQSGATVNLAASSQTGPECMQRSKPGLDWLTNNQFINTMAHSNQAHPSLPRQVVESKGLVGHGGLMGQGMAGLGGLGLLAENALPGPDLGVGLGGAPCLNPGSLAVKTDSPTSPMSDGVGPSYGSMSSLSPLPYGLDGAGGGRKRGFEGSLEKVVERRQRRMIKNRESAARSRARKQAYTVELEAEVMQLKEENLRLRLLQEEMVDIRRKQFMDVLTSLGRHVAPKVRTLRRTQTVPW